LSHPDWPMSLEARQYALLLETFLSKNEKDEIFKINGVDTQSNTILGFNLGQGETLNAQISKLSKVKELESDCNKIFTEWLKTASFTSSGSFDQIPTEDSKQQLINLVQSKLTELKGLGFKLGMNPSPLLMWLTVKDDGQPSHYIGI